MLFNAILIAAITIWLYRDEKENKDLIWFDLIWSLSGLSGVEYLYLPGWLITNMPNDKWNNLANKQPHWAAVSRKVESPFPGFPGAVSLFKSI